MKLAINGRFYRAGVTGVQRFAREVTARLCELADVTLLLPRGVEPPQLTRRVRVLHGRLGGHAWEQLELPHMSRAAGCDATLHLSGTAPVRGGPHVLVLHDVLPLTHPDWFSRRFAGWYAAVLGRAVPRAAAVITVSETSRREIVRAFGEPRRLFVVSQGLDPFTSPATDGEVARVRADFGLPGQWLLALGFGDPRKNHTFLLDVLAELRARGQPRRLVIVGQTATRVHGRPAEPLGPDVLTPGYVSDRDLQALYTGCSALCFPSLAEGFGRPPLEAAACGAPSLIADTPDLPERTRLAGLTVPLRADAWADAVSSLESDAELRADTVRRGRSLGDDMSWDECAYEVLGSCLAAAGRRRARPTHTAGR